MTFSSILYLKSIGLTRFPAIGQTGNSTFRPVDIYYSGKNIEFNYIIGASAIAGPLLLILTTLVCLVLGCVKKYSNLEKKGIKTKTKRKNLVAFVLVGIYISFYIWILDIFAVYTASTSSHEYEPELSRHHAFNLIVAYITFACDSLFCFLILITLAIIWYLDNKIWCTKHFKKWCTKCSTNNVESGATNNVEMKTRESSGSASGAGGAALDAGGAERGAGGTERGAGGAEPHAGGAERDAGDAERGAGDAERDAGDAERDAGDAEQGAGDAERDAGGAERGAGDAEQDAGGAERGAEDAEHAGDAERGARGAEPSAGGASPTDDVVINSLLFPSLLIFPFLSFTSHLGYIILAWITQPSRSTTTLILYYFILFYLYLIFRASYKYGSKLLSKSKSESESEPESKNINVSMFICNIILGIVYLGIAVIFIVIVYLKPLASEDLFSYIFNVVQFIIVVVSTQYFYKLIVGKSFSIKKILKTVHEIISNTKEYKEYKPHEKENLDRKTGRLVAALIGPQLPPQEQATDTTIQES